MRLQDNVLRAWSMSFIKKIGPQSHIEDAFFWKCVQLNKAGTRNKILCPRTTLGFEKIVQKI